MHASPTKNGAPGVRREIVIDFSNDRSSNTETVREVVGDLDLPQSRVSEGPLAELKDIMNADYRTAPALPAPETVRFLVHILSTSVNLRSPDWKKWRCHQDFACECRTLTATRFPFMRHLIRGERAGRCGDSPPI